MMDILDWIKNNILILLVLVVVVLLTVIQMNRTVSYYVYDSDYDKDFAKKVSDIISNTDWYKYKVNRVMDRRSADIKIKLSDKEELEQWHKSPEYYPSGKQIRFSITTQSKCDKPRIFIDKDNWLNGVAESRLTLDKYRNYVIRHEFLHALGMDHQECTPGKDKVCSVMYQSTRGCPTGTECGYEVKKEDFYGPKIPGRYL